MPLFSPVTAPGVPPQYMALADVTVANTTTETSVLSATALGSTVLAAGRLLAGTTLQVQGGGVYSIPALTPGGATIRVKLGGVTVASATVGNLIGGVTGAAFAFDCAIVCRSTGASGVVASVGGLNFATTAGGRVFSDLLNGASNVTVNTTQPLTLDVTFAWDVASASRTMTVRGAIVTLIN